MHRTPSAGFEAVASIYSLHLFWSGLTPSSTSLMNCFRFATFLLPRTASLLPARLLHRLSPTAAPAPALAQSQAKKVVVETRHHALRITMAEQTAAPARLGFIGAGMMAEAIARGLDRSGLVPSHSMSASDVNAARCDVFKSFGASVFNSNSQVASNSDVLVLAVKPQTAKQVLLDLKPSLTDKHLLISIAAGVTLANLQEWAGEARVVRVMPNTPCLVGATAAALSVGSRATLKDADYVKTLFQTIGTIHVVDEKLLDAVTGLSGSGPAFVFLAIEALADGGVAAGLPRDVALSLAAQTVYGSAKMVLDTGKHPGQLKDQVASPAGTTIAGIHALEKAGFRAALMDAVVAASKRSEEFSKM